MTNRRSKGRPVDGLLLLDKPIGITSNKALQDLKRLFQAQKAGHTGSLDPLATGMLPICFGEATKFSQYLLDSDKSYETTAKLGVITDSGDAEGNVIETRKVDPITKEQLEKILEKFRGKIAQTPPMFSALKQGGRPLYELARQGIEVHREAREITVYDLECLSLSEDELRLRARVSKGTYIRSLVEDIGLALGCGAHVSKLRRTGVSHFTEEKMLSLDELKKRVEVDGQDALNQLLLPVDAFLESLPIVYLTEKASAQLQHGQRVRVEEAVDEAEVRIYDHREKFIGLGWIENQFLKAKRLISAGNRIPTSFVEQKN
jgi:tRNA pseudouridine55 synthase